MQTPDELLVTTRIDSAKQAIGRARNVLLINALVAVTLFVADFNGYFSWYRYFVIVPKVNDITREASTFPKDIRESYLKVAQEQMVKSWVESRMITVSPLGIRFGVGDIAIIGPPALFILAIVFWYCARRENHTIVRILRESKDDIYSDREDARKIRASIYHAVASHLVFMPVNEVSKPLQGLKASTKEKPSRLVRIGFRMLLYAPRL
jgi:hypothetical protein